MKTKNFLKGDSYHAIYARSIYKLIKSRSWFSFADVVADTKSLASSSDLSRSVSKSDCYGELKKAFMHIRKAIEALEGDSCIEENGNNRSKRFKYVGKSDEPLADMINAQAMSDITKYWQFCQDSSGFFPTSWLEHFFKGYKDLIEIKQKRNIGEEFVSASVDRELRNVEYLPLLYESIRDKQVLEIDYRPSYENEVKKLMVHPHFLKEYNGRWHLYGYVEGEDIQEGYDMPLDRMEGKPREVYKVPFKPAPKGFYREYFGNIIGTSHIKPSIVYPIQIRAYGHVMFKLTETKPLHCTQKVILPYDETLKYGDFQIEVELNNEFFGRILHMGASLEIISPKEVRDEMTKRVQELQSRYI